MSVWKRRVVKVLPYGADAPKTVSNAGASYIVNASAGDTLTFQFPHGVIDLSTLCFMFTWVRLHPSAGETLPRDTETLLEELEVMLGDTVVNKITNYPQLFFILSTYAQDAEWVPGYGGILRVWTNRRITTHNAGITGAAFGMEKFLGFLDSGAVIDTRKTGKLTVRMRLSDSAAVVQSVAAASWGMLNPFFRVTYLPDDSEGAKRITFDDFTSVRQSFPGYTSRTTLIVDGRRKIDYVLARAVNMSNVDNKQTSQPDAWTMITNRFTATANNMAAWNILVNGARYHSSEPDLVDAYLTLAKDVFPGKMWNHSNSGNAFTDSTFWRSWAAGAKLDLPQRDDGEQHEISFETVAAPSATNVRMYGWVWAKTTSTVDVSTGKLELSV